MVALRHELPGQDLLTARRRIGAVFALQAFALAMMHMRIPDLQLRAGLDESQLGLVLMAAPIGASLVFVMTAPMVEAFGTRFLFLVSLPFLSLSAAVLSLTTSMPVMFAVFFVNGALSASGSVAMSIETDRIEAGTGARIMNRCHGMWSVGYFLSSLAAGAVRSAGVDPALHLWAVVPIVAIVAVAVAGPMIQFPPRAFAGASRRTTFASPTPAVLAIVAFGLGVSLLENTSLVWATILVRDTFDVAPMVESSALPALIMAMALARLVSDRFIDIHGPRRVGGVTAALAFAGLTIVVFAPNAWLVVFGFAVAGLGSGVAFPLMMSVAARLGDRPASQNVAAVTLIVQLALLCLPMAVGAIAEAWSVRAAYGCLLPLIAVGLLMSRKLR
jgi:MFS family permease